MAYTVISRPNCPWCDKAMALLYEVGIEYEKVDMTMEPWVRTLILKTDITTVPQVFDHNGVHIGGHEELVMHINNLDIYQ